MTPPPAVRVNTFLEEKKETNVDFISKIYIATGLLCGINRVPVFDNINPMITTLSLAFSLSINFTHIYLTVVTLLEVVTSLKILKLCQYCMCALLAIVLRKRLRDFYSELNAFDMETGYRRLNNIMIKDIVQMFFIMGFLIIFVGTFSMLGFIKINNLYLSIILLIHIAELYFFGHLFSLLVPRVRYIRRLMKSFFENRCCVTTVENELISLQHRNSAIDMKRLMAYYHRVIIAFDLLNDAIKWQMLIIFITCFITSLKVSYDVTLQYIRGNYLAMTMLAQVTIAAFETIPMFAPCRAVDAVHGAVRCLRELLSSKLYGNKIEKPSRAVSQALLALMEARDLSFSLLHIFDIDVSFPFKFLGLLITYLIILLQFEKVINPARPVA